MLLERGKKMMIPNPEHAVAFIDMLPFVAVLAFVLLFAWFNRQ
jgi:hypothetical protein